MTLYTPTLLPHGCPQPLPEPQDACGIGYIVRVDGTPSRRVVTMALEALANHAHRGAVAADGRTGDGAGVMTQLPYEFLARVYQSVTGNTSPAR
ncbi:MAG: hypothetical protein KC910_20485, partial [Candidatus Eremiobacteraeota bacterium]|nr:hypothetical protein [Candidatus Eremiobacteraeota bacterium]